jgi:hypothetical protein
VAQERTAAAAAAAGSSGPVAGRLSTAEGRARCSAAMRVLFVVTASLGTAAFAMLCLYVAGLSVLLVEVCDGNLVPFLVFLVSSGPPCTDPGPVPPRAAPRLACALRRMTRARVRAGRGLGVAADDAADGRAGGGLHLAPLARLLQRRRQGAALPHQVPRVSEHEAGTRCRAAAPAPSSRCGGTDACARHCAHTAP